MNEGRSKERDRPTREASGEPADISCTLPSILPLTRSGPIIGIFPRAGCRRQKSFRLKDAI